MKKKNGELERVSDLPQAAQLISTRVKPRPQVFCVLFYVTFCYTA